MASPSGNPAANRSDIRNFLISRRAKLTPAQVGLPAGGRRRVPGLRREEVALLAGVSTEWYTRLEKGRVNGVSEDVLNAVAQALRLGKDERTHLFDMARAARSTRRPPQHSEKTELPAPVHWMLESMTISAVFVRDRHLDIVAANTLCRALYAPLFDSPTTAERGHANLSRYLFLDPGSTHFFADWDAAAQISAALLRAEAGRRPHDRALRELIGELSTLSPEFRTRWARHDVRLHHEGTKHLRHPEVGDLELPYRSLNLPLPGRPDHEVVIYTAEPGTTTEDRLKLLSSWAATASSTAGHSPAKKDWVEDRVRRRCSRPRRRGWGWVR
ncbi:helix-turn-helix transcriptional regulator [Nocardia carnea]|uniref:helix-turn-helix transcriptional regulator n=1 Tax=Nocardia carnea TaxID=37328 RepID=UPI00245683A6|nr:helix-turn-helix transcriptional regulator [Nocardia carnea]